jgi:oxygen-dependent protoporphyrinogen oxidase
VIGTIQQEGFQFELGPQSFLSNPSILELISELGLKGEVLRGDSKAARYVLVRGALRRVPMAPPELLGTSLLSLGTKLKLLVEPLRKSQPPDGDESVASFVRRKFGTDLLENLVGPFVSGVHAGDPERLSLRSAFPSVYHWEREYGSVLKGAMRTRPAKDAPQPTLCSFRGGMEALVRTMGGVLGETLQTGAQVLEVRRGKANGSSHYEVQVKRGGRQEMMSADALVVAADAAGAAAILGPMSPQIRDLLGRIESAPVEVVGGGYRREQVGHAVEGFGFLVPRRENLRVLGTVWCSSLFAGRAPAGMVNLTSFVGGATDERLMTQEEKEIAEEAEREVGRVLKISGAPVTRLVKRWERALPQYNVGHSQIVSGLGKELERFPGLFLTGNYLGGASVGSCVEQAEKTTKSVQEYLETRGAASSAA